MTQRKTNLRKISFSVLVIKTAFLIVSICTIPQFVLAQKGTPWSRGVQQMEFGFDECKTRARAALGAERYGVTNENTGFNNTDYYVAGQNEIHTAVITCNFLASGRTWVNMFISSSVAAPTGALPEAERVKLQTRMGQANGGVSTGTTFGGKWDAYAWDVITIEQKGDSVTGWYTGLGSGTFQGTMRGDNLYFTFKDAAGRVGEAVMSPINKNTGSYNLHYCDTGKGCDPMKQGYVGATKRR